MSSVFLIIQINRGMVIYICFFKGATEDIIPKMGMQLLLSHMCNKTYCMHEFWNVINYIGYSSSVFFSLSQHSAEHEALWDRIWKVYFSPCTTWQYSHSTPSHTWRKAKGKRDAVPWQHWERWRLEALRQLCVSLSKWTLSLQEQWHCYRGQTWNVWKPTSTEAGYKRTLYSSDGVLRLTFSLVCRIVFTVVISNIWVIEGPIWTSEVQKTVNAHL